MLIHCKNNPHFEQNRQPQRAAKLLSIQSFSLTLCATALANLHLPQPQHLHNQHHRLHNRDTRTYYAMYYTSWNTPNTQDCITHRTLSTWAS